jgi:hypothetical protein
MQKTTSAYPKKRTRFAQEPEKGKKRRTGEGTAVNPPGFNKGGGMMLPPPLPRPTAATIPGSLCLEELVARLHALETSTMAEKGPSGSYEAEATWAQSNLFWPGNVWGLKA